MTFFTPDQVARLSDTTVRVATLVQMEFKTTTVRFWNGNTVLDQLGFEWLPTFGIGSIDGIATSSTGSADKITFHLPGIPSERLDILALALSEAHESFQRPVKVFLQFFDDNWQIVGLPILIWFGFLQTPRVTRSVMGEDSGGNQTISIEAINAFYNRARPPFGRYTDRDQQKRYPNDQIFEFVPSMLFKSFAWPDF